MKKVFLICSGVGHINRGYESFTTECFQALKQSDAFRMMLLKGAGASDESEKKIWCIRRNTRTARALAKLLRKEAYWVEQFSFLIGMLPYLLKHRPSLIYYSDFLLGTWLWHLRRFLGFRYKLLYSNGAPNGPPFTRTDHIQQLLPSHLQQAVAGGTPLHQQSLLPYGIQMEPELVAWNKKQRREELALPADKKIVLSVGAINRRHKRMDYVVDEISRLSNDYFLVMLGQFDEETNGILEEANRKLPGRFMVKNVPYHLVAQYYQAADYFVLASLHEGFGRVFLEAMLYGLPCFAHNYPVAREVLQHQGVFFDARERNALCHAIDNYTENSNAAAERYAFLYHHYSWNKLRADYEKMMLKAIVSNNTAL